MQKKIKRNKILFAKIQGDNESWIRKQMKKLGYNAARGKAEFVDDFFTSARKKNASP